MKKHRGITLATVVVAAMAVLPLCPTGSKAQDEYSKVRSTVGHVLMIPRGVRNLALGGIGAADPVSPDNAYYNPAVALAISGVHFTTGHNNFYAHLDYSDYNLYSGYSLPINDTWAFRFGGGVRYTEQRLEAVERTVFLPEGTGRTFSNTDKYYAIVLGCGLSSGGFDFGAGWSVKPATLQMGESKLKFEAYDVGVFARRVFELGSGARLIPSLGFSLLNLGSVPDYGDYQLELPEQFRVGVGIRFESRSSPAAADRLGIDRPIVSVAAVAEYLERRWYRDEKEGTALGLETGILDVVFLRIFHTDNTLYTDGGGYGFGLGWQFGAVRVRYDYARVPTIPFLGEDHFSAHGGTVIVDF